ncbi:MAG: carboxypeptidase regulatory-like domain-containing protein [Elusimicrobiota bacterium]
MSRSARGNSGATLMELMVATVVMTVAVIGLMGSFGGIQKALQVSKNKTLASNLAQEKMQILKQKNYYQVLVDPNPSYRTDYTPNIPYDATYFPPETILEGSITYTRLTEIQVAMEDSGSIVILPPNTPDTGMRLITVTVLWSVGGDLKKLSVNSVLANPNTVMTNSVYTGLVKDAVTTNPIVGALVNLAENLGWRDTTDNTGKYRITVSPGSFTMVVSAPGYFTQYLPTSIISNTITTLPTFNMTPMSSGTASGSAWMEPNVVISQVVADTYTMVGDGSMQDVEYIELFNPTTASLYIGTTGDTYQTNKPALWITSESGDFAYEYNCAWFRNANILCLNYVTSNIPAQSYFLISNADRFMLNGIWVTADAYYTPVYTTHHLSANGQAIPAIAGGGVYPVNVTKAGSVSLYNFIAWAHTPNFAVTDQVRWDSLTGSNVWTYNSQIISTPTIANCCGNTSLGFPQGNELVRLSSPTFSADVVNFGRAYNSQNNQADFLAPNATFSQLPYLPHNVSSGAYTVISGVPAVGAVISANDGLSDPATAYLRGFPPSANFLLTNIATATMPSPWTVLITSGGYTLENDSVTVAATGSNYRFPSSTTILNQNATQGFISGTVTDILGNPITAPSLIQVNPGVNGAPQNASAASGRYLLRVSTGSVDVIANPNYLNNNYVSGSSLSVTVALGQISDGVNFMLSQGGQISGFVTRDGVNALPGVAVTAFDINGYARDTRVTDNNGRFTTLTIASGTYSVAPELDSLENSSPANTPVTVTGGATVFSTTFTISGALGTVMGSVTAGGKAISTGVLVVVTTSTLAGSPPVPPTLSSNTLASNSYYIASSREDGTYSIDVRQSTSPAYRIYGYYTTLNSTGAVTIQSQTLTNVQVLAGSSVTGNNFAW